MRFGILQGKQARSMHGGLAGPQAAVSLLPRAEKAFNSSAVAVEYQQAQSSLLVPHHEPVRPMPTLERPVIAESAAERTKSGTIRHRTMASDQSGKAGHASVVAPSASTAGRDAGRSSPPAGTAGQGTLRTKPSAGQITVKSGPSAGTPPEANSTVSLFPRAIPQGSPDSEAQSPGSQPGTPSWQRTPGGQPPTPISSHPIADELNADSDSAASSADAPLSKQPLFHQTEADSPSAHCDLGAACQLPCQDASTAEPHHTQQTTTAAAAAYNTAAGSSQGNTERPAPLDASTVLLDFGDVDEDRLLSPASTSASERLTPVQHLPKPAADAPLFSRDPTAADEPHMLSAHSPHGTDSSILPAACGPRGGFGSPSGVNSLESNADHLTTLPTISPINPWSPSVSGMHIPAALSDMLVDIPSSSTLVAARRSAPGSLGNPVATSAPSCSAPTEAAYCAAAEQLHTAVQQAAQLYTQALASAQHAADADAYGLRSGIPESSVGAEVSTSGRQQASRSSQQTGHDASDALARRALRRMPPSGCTAAAAWVPQDNGTSAHLYVAHQDAVDHEDNTGISLDKIAV